MTRFDPEPRDSDVCIGQLVPSVQHAIRASAVACHPAHTARLPTHNVRTAATAATRLANVIQLIACGTGGAVSTCVLPRDGLGPQVPNLPVRQ
jgi:hypothetical protein